MADRVPVSHITDDALERAARALSTYICCDPEQWKFYTEHARLALEAAGGVSVGCAGTPGAHELRGQTTVHADPSVPVADDKPNAITARWVTAAHERARGGESDG